MPVRPTDPSTSSGRRKLKNRAPASTAAFRFIAILIAILSCLFCLSSPYSAPRPSTTPTPTPLIAPAPDTNRLHMDTVIRLGPKPGNAILPSYMVYNDLTRRLYVSSRISGTISVVDCCTLAVISVIAIDDPWPGPMALHRGRNKLYVLNESDGTTGGGTVTVIDTETNTVLTTLTHSDSPAIPGWFDVELAEAYDRLFVADSSKQAVHIFDTQNDTHVDTIDLRGLIRVGGLDRWKEIPLPCMTFCDPYLLVAGTGGTQAQGSLFVHNVLSGETDSFDAGLDDEPYSIAVDHTRQLAHITTISGRKLLTFDLEHSHWLPIKDFRTDGLDTRAVAIDPDVDRLYVAGTRLFPTSIIAGEKVDKPYGVSIQVLSASRLERIATVELDGVVRLSSIKELQPAPAIDSKTHNVLVPNRVQGTVVIFDTNGKVVAEPAVGRFPSTIEIDEKNRRAFVAGADSNNIAVINLDSFTVDYFTTLGEVVDLPVVSEEGNLVAVGSSSSDRVALIDGNSGAVSSFIDTSGIPRDLEIDESLGRLYIGTESRSEEPGYLDVVSLPAAERILSSPLRGNGTALRVNPVDRRVFVASWPTLHSEVINGTVEVFDPIDGQREKIIEVGHQPVVMELDSDNQVLYVGNEYDVTISTISTETLEQVELVGNIPSVGARAQEGLMDSMAAYPPFRTLFFSSPDAISTTEGSRYYVGMVDTGHLQDAVELSGKPGFMLMDEEAGRIYVSTDISEETGAVSVLDARYSELIAELPVGAGPRQLSQDRGSGLIYVAVSGGKQVAVIDPDLLQTAAVVSPGKPVEGIAVNSRTHLAYGTLASEGAVVVVSDEKNPVELPLPPEGVSAEPGDESVSLTWFPQDEAVKGYNVYRAYAPDGPYGQVNSETIPPNSYFFLDSDLINHVPVYYKVTGIAEHNIESRLETIQPVPSKPEAVEGPDFSISVLGENSVLHETIRISVTPGRQTRTSILYQSLRGFTSPVTLAVESTLPEGMTVEISDEYITVDELEPGGKKVIDLILDVGKNVEPESIPPVRITATDTNTGSTKKLVIFVTLLFSRQISMSLSSQEIFFGEDAIVFGTVKPAESGIDVQLVSDGVPVAAGTTDIFGYYSIVFHPPEPGEYRLNTSFGGATGLASKSKTLTVLRGKTRVVLSTDRRIDVSTGPIPVNSGVTIQGQILPNPEMSTVDLIVKKPSGTTVTLDGIVTTPAGFFGLSVPFKDAFDPSQSMRMDERGVYRIQAVYRGNLDFLPSESEELRIPVGIAPDNFGKAIIVAGGGLVRADDQFRPSVDYLTGLTYQTLRDRRFSKDDIYLLTQTGEFDVDGDGENDARGKSSVAAVGGAIGQWAASRPPTEPLVIYFVGHGALMDPDCDGIPDDEIFRCVGSTEDPTIDPEHDLTSEQLALFLDSLPAEKPVTVILECCHSGSFVDNLAGPGRIIITSSSPENKTRTDQDGRVSFSQFLWDRVSLSQDLRSAFLAVRQDVANLSPIFHGQSPCLDDDGDGIANEENEGSLLAAGRQIGYSFNSGEGFGISNSIPIIDAVSADRTLSKPGEAEILASVKDPDGNEDIAEVFATITPPDDTSTFSAANYGYFSTPTLDLERIDLHDRKGDGVYRAMCGAFQKPGAYQVSLFARDNYGHTAVIREIVVEIQEAAAGKNPSAQTKTAQKKTRRRSFITIGVQGEKDTGVDSWKQHNE